MLRPRWSNTAYSDFSRRATRRIGYSRSTSHDTQSDLAQHGREPHGRCADAKGQGQWPGPGQGKAHGQEHP
eukprot:12963492-Heterocapsa_arctica.AAC.1